MIQLIILVAVINILLAPFIKFKGQLFCGLIGFTGTKKVNTDKLGLLMLHNSLKRGEDNTGLYSIETGTVKSALKAEEFLGTYDLPKTKLFIGHVRKASVGSKLEKNAHPVEFDNIVLAHNGTLTNHHELCRTNGYSFHTDFDTDTQVLAQLMDNCSKSESGRFTILSEYTGFAALLFTDKRDKDVLYAYRNDDRPLFNGLTAEGMYFSSMEESLKIIGCKDIKEVSPYYVHAFKHGTPLSSVSYPKKTVPISSAITNVTYKAGKALDDFVKRIKKISDVTSDTLVDRWVRAVTSFDDFYEGIETKTKITKDKWYFIKDIHPDADYDLQFVDDNGNTVYHNKYVFSISHFDYPNECAIAIKNIFSVENPAQIIIKNGALVELPKNFIITEDNKLPCLIGEDLYEVDIDLMRPATDEEVVEFLDKQVTKINHNLSSPFVQQALDFRNLPTIKKPLLLDGIKEQVVLEVTNPEVVGAETETVIEDSTDETTAVVGFILDAIDNKLDDVLELAESTSWEELKTGVSELKDIVNESYNIGLVKENLSKN